MCKRQLKKLALAAVVAGAGLGASVASADSFDSVLQVGQATNEAAQASQKKIDKIADETRDLATDYRQVLKQVDGLKVYNKRMQAQIDNQAKRLNDITQSIEDAKVIDRQIVPLTLRMIDSLEQFISLDMPFHLGERKKALAELRANMDRSEFTAAEKFRQVLEVYKIESEYGRKIDSYTDTVDVNGAPREVNVLRVGRIALLYQTTDGVVTGAWDNKARQWVEVSASDYRSAVKQGVRIAKKQASIEILNLPVPAPEAVQ